jgi:hypothetical protein
MNKEKLQLIKNAVKLVQAGTIVPPEKLKSLQGIERQALAIADREYVNVKKIVDNVSELNFN